MGLSFKENILKSFERFDFWFNTQSSHVDDICLSCFPKGEIFSQKHISDFYVKFHMYMNSDAYQESVNSLLTFYNSGSQGPEFNMLTSVLFYLEKQCILDFQNI